MSGEIRYYRGLHKVKVITQSEGYWIVEALEDFDDCLEKETTPVKTGEQRIVPRNLVFKEKAFPPMVTEHEYELKMEKKLKKIIAEEEANQAETKRT